MSELNDLWESPFNVPLHTFLGQPLQAMHKHNNETQNLTPTEKTDTVNTK